jgi:N-acetyl-anhydromuramyl-L-alanine amidase AmpD
VAKADLSLLPAPPPLPALWLPDGARVERIIWHWTAGGSRASALDRLHYHLLIERDGRVVRGARPIGKYLPHTRMLNTGSAGIALCGMHGATQGKDGGPLSFGTSPLSPIQFLRLVQVSAQLMDRYHLPMQEKTALCHGDVQRVTGIQQKGKWDIGYWPGKADLRGPRAVGQALRRAISARTNPFAE